MNLIKMEKGGLSLLIHPLNVDDHQRLGWQVSQDQSRQDDEISEVEERKQLMAELKAKGVRFSAKASIEELRAMHITE